MATKNEKTKLKIEYVPIETIKPYAGNAKLHPQEQIASKRKSLEGVLVPITARWNEDMLKAAGFRKIDCFWRNLNFAGWIAIK